MQNLGYGSGYIYDHDTEGGISGQNYFPEGMERQTFYTPKGQESEAEVLLLLKELEILRRKCTN